MRNIYYFSSFDPITNKELNFILDNKDNTFFHFFIIKGFESFADRVDMLSLVLDQVKYEINDLTNSIEEKIDLTKIIENNNENFLLLEDKEMILVPSKIIINNKFKILLKENIISDAKNIRSLKNISTNKKIVDYIVENRLYFMKIIEKYYKPKRLLHAISVANLAYKIAIENNLENIDLYFIAGLLHDIAKKMDDYDALEIIEKYYPKYSNEPKWVYHEITGSFLAKKLFPNVDNRVIDAIFVHTTGKANMTPLEKVLYSADDIEPTRDYDSQYLIDACLKDFEYGFRYTMKEVQEFNKSKNNAKSKLLEECIDFYKEN